MDWRDESLALLPADVPDERIAELGLNLLRGDLLLPALVVKESALAHNIALMADYCREYQLSLAPHAKVTMVPKIIRRQVVAGAWAVCAATMSQVRTLREVGLGRLFLVNELVEPTAVNWVVAELAGDSQFEFLCLVDSMAGVELLSDLLASAGQPDRCPYSSKSELRGEGRVVARSRRRNGSRPLSRPPPVSVWWGLRVLSRLLSTLTLPMSLRPSMVSCL